MLEVQSVYWKNGRGFSLTDISLTLHGGTLTALMGANGAGKSTLLRLMSGELRPDCGQILLNNTPIETLSRRAFAQCVAVIRQERAFTFPMSCIDLVLTGRTPYLGFMGRTGQRERRMAEEAMERTDTRHLAGASFEEISGGEKQRVMLARALLQEPKVLLLDEAFSAMDARQAVRAMNLVKELTCEKQIAALCIVHDLHIAHAFADRIVLLENGRILADDTPDHVCVSPAMRRLTGRHITLQSDGSLNTRILSEGEI
jgi:iron complex transport system ATP-binding protein